MPQPRKRLLNKQSTAITKQHISTTQEKHSKLKILLYFFSLIAAIIIMRQLFSQSKTASTRKNLIKNQAQNIESLSVEDRILLEHPELRYQIEEPANWDELDYSVRIAQLGSTTPPGSTITPEEALNYIRIVYYNNGIRSSTDGPANDKARLTQFKTSMRESLKSASGIARRIAGIFLSHPDSQVSLYTRNPDPQADDTIGQAIAASQSIRYYQAKNPSGEDLVHETLHMGAQLLTFPNVKFSPTIRVTDKHIIVNGRPLRTFPCEQDNHFYETWAQEVKQNILRFKPAIFGEQNINGLKSFLKKASVYEPQFGLILQTPDLRQLEKEGLAVGNIMNFKKTSFKPWMHPVIENAYAPDGINPADYYEMLFSSTNLKVTVINDNTDAKQDRLVSAIYVAPLSMEPVIKAMHLIARIEKMLNHVSQFESENLHCEEAFASALQFSAQILEHFMPKTLEYLEQRLKEYLPEEASFRP